MGFCFGIKGLRGCWLTLHTRRPERCRERTTDGAPADRHCTDFLPFTFSAPLIFFSPGAWVPVCVSLSFVIFCLARGPCRLNSHLKDKLGFTQGLHPQNRVFFTPVFIGSCCFTLWGRAGRELVGVITQMCVGKTSVCNWSPPLPRLQQHPSHLAIAPRACSIRQC